MEKEHTPHISIDNYFDSDLHELLHIIKKNGKPLNEFKLQDFLFDGDVGIYPGKGCYFFIFENEIIYVGKCSSKTFVGRVPGHLGTYEKDWFNTLVTHKNLDYIFNDKKNRESFKNQSLTEVSHFAFNNFSLVLLNFPEDYTNKIAVFESALRKSIDTLINKTKSRLKTENLTVREILDL